MAARDQTSSEAFAAQARSAKSPVALRNLFSRTIRPFGFSAFAAGLLPQAHTRNDGPDSPFVLIDWPRAWLELYAREGFAKDDLLIVEALSREDPITWTEFQALRPGASARIFAAALAFGWQDGMLVPIRLPHHDGSTRVGVVSLAAPQRLELCDDHRTALTGMARVTFEHAYLMGRTSEASTLRLSGREASALSLVARGLSDEGIAQELGVSKDTAHLHVERAKRRLGATTRAQAVAAAISLGLIESF